MDKLKIEGNFWLSSEPSHRVAGVLKFSPAQGGRLRLFGSLFPTRLPSSGRTILKGLDRTEVRVLGASDGKCYTLEGCGLTRASEPAFGSNEFPSREEYYVNSVLAGCHVPGPGSPSVCAFSVQLKNLEEWTGSDGVSVQYDTDETGRRVRRMELSCELLDEKTTDADFGQLSIAHTVRVRPRRRFDWSIRQGCKAYVTYRKPTSLTDAFGMAGNLSALVSIATDRRSSIGELRIRIATDSDGSDNGTPSWATVYADLLASHGASKTRPTREMDYLFHFRDVDGVAGLCRWITADARFNAAMGEILHYWHVDKPYIGNRIVGLSIAAERIYRWAFNITNVSVKLNRVFRRLAKAVRPAFEQVVGDIEEWTAEITQTRHDAAHGDLRVDDNRAYALAETIYLLVVLNLLRQTGADAQVLFRIGQHHRWARVSACLAGSAPEEST